LSTSKDKSAICRYVSALPCFRFRLFGPTLSVKVFLLVLLLPLERSARAIALSALPTAAIAFRVFNALFHIALLSQV
jgi:hypothetical protein